MTPAECCRTSPVTERGWPQDDALQHQPSRLPGPINPAACLAPSARARSPHAGRVLTLSCALPAAGWDRALFETLEFSTVTDLMTTVAVVMRVVFGLAQLRAEARNRRDLASIQFIDD